MSFHLIPHPQGEPWDPLPSLGGKIAAMIRARTETDASFLILPVRDTRDACEWILASFHAPLTVVPVPAHLPPAARQAMLDQLPSGSFVHAQELNESPAPASTSPKDLSLPWVLIFTSGSSGTPKAIALSGKALRASAEAHAKHLGSHPWLLNLPPYHIGGFSILSRAFFLGETIGLAGTGFQATETLVWLGRGDIHGLSLVPTTLHRLLEAGVSDYKDAIKCILLGGAPADAPLLERARGLPVHRTYGMTEHASQAATEKDPGSGMVALPGVDLRISGKGEILVRSSMLADGYYSGGEWHPLPLEEGFFATGDLGSLHGGTLTVEGRRHERMISGGMKTFPAEIESPLRDFPSLLDAAVVSLPDPEWGEKIWAAYVPRDPECFSQQTVKDFLRTRIDGRKVPKAWVQVDRIPRSALGKVQRAELRALIRKIVSEGK
jgi:O-succinylbenzoic acid--CoA ligase